MTEENLRSLAWDAIGGEVGSWVDPLFQGPTPVGDLPGLGDRYRDLVLIGEGATAQVFKAMDTLLQRQVALKVLKDKDATALAEARAQAQVEHPNVCRIYEVGQNFIVMQLMEGATLARLAPTLDLTSKLRLMRDIAQGIHAAHQRGLVHLDLKLNNILMQAAADGTYQPVVGDFGMVLSHAAERFDSCPMGTPPYTSPEQLAGDVSRLGPHTDVYSLGVMLYVLIAGCIPFDAMDFKRLLECISQEDPVPLRQRVPNVPRDLEAVVRRCMQKNPDARYGSARELALELDRFLAGEALSVMGSSWLYRTGKWIRRHRRMGWAIGLGLTALLVSSGFGIQYSRYVYQRAEWDHHFQKLLGDMRSLLDHAYRLPAHDIEPELVQARTILKTIETEMKSNGRASKGPGYLALGQAMLLLNPQDPAAARQFQTAWDLGFQTEGARTWLAFSLLGAFRKAQTDAWTVQDKVAAERIRDTARQQYLEPARRMLQGRRDSDQARLSHLAEQAEVWARENPDPDRAIALARMYRARFPDDLDGWLEEVDALTQKANQLWRRSADASPAWPPPCDTEVGPLRERIGHLLEQALRIAPSHPGIYMRLARASLIQIRLPTESLLDREAVLEQARRWLDQGRRVSAQNLSLNAVYAGYLCGEALDFRLSRGLSREPIEREFRAFMRDSFATGNGELVDQLLFSILNYTQTCEWHGQASLEFENEALHLLKEHPREGSLQLSALRILPVFLLKAGQFALELGGDPTPYLAFAGESGDSGAGDRADVQLLQMNLLQADYLNTIGADASGPLRLAEHIWQERARASSEHQTELELRLLQAKVFGRTEDWEALDALLTGMRSDQGQRPSSQGLDLLTKGSLLLARHKHDVGEDAVPLLRLTRGSLEAAMRKASAPALLNLRLRMAELCLIESRVTEGAAEPLRKGLEETDQILQVIRPGSQDRAARAIRTQANFQGLEGLPHLGRVLAMRGELLLALARVEAPEKRRRWALQAQEAFVDAIHRNGNLRNPLAPFIQDAHRLATQPALRGG
ncbi:serine/threonine-protein kinase [Geothrix limicola]|uniref:serine/threonine-protein kinase n=1 Tax=Geothrix limicola TaxID=2927978 RepID=UPI002556E4CA|nr:serine/threonine-protein kinase [Geothrix limicola]